MTELGITDMVVQLSRVKTPHTEGARKKDEESSSRTHLIKLIVFLDQVTLFEARAWFTQFVTQNKMRFFGEKIIY